MDPAVDGAPRRVQQRNVNASTGSCRRLRGLPRLAGSQRERLTSGDLAVYQYADAVVNDAALVASHAKPDGRVRARFRERPELGEFRRAVSVVLSDHTDHDSRTYRQSGHHEHDGGGDARRVPTDG
jgi:hypothetical protein